MSRWKLTPKGLKNMYIILMACFYTAALCRLVHDIFVYKTWFIGAIALWCFYLYYPVMFLKMHIYDRWIDKFDNWYERTF